MPPRDNLRRQPTIIVSSVHVLFQIVNHASDPGSGGAGRVRFDL